MEPRPPLNVSIAYRIYRLQRLLRRHFLTLSEEAGFHLTQEQFFILDKLSRQDGLTQTELADPALLDRANVTRMVRELEGRGLIARRSDPSDGRLKRVHLTRDGAATLDGFFEDVIGPARGTLFGEASPDDLQAAHRVFDALESHLTT